MATDVSRFPYSPLGNLKKIPNLTQTDRTIMATRTRPFVFLLRHCSWQATIRATVDREISRGKTTRM